MWYRCGAAALLAACAAPAQLAPPAAGGAQAASAGYHGTVVWMGPARRDTVAVSFAADWRRTAAGTDTAWTFRDAAAGQVVYGRREGGTLVWGIGGMRGDMGVATDFSGAIEPDGRVRGCSVPARRGRVQGPRGAFVLAPRSAPRPGAADAPVARCEAGGP
ncbi:MAG TPA: hypothetical protein VF613_12330 [Longimicrobium sp.]|jgi:hypothetical protein